MTLLPPFKSLFALFSDDGYKGSPYWKVKTLLITISQAAKTALLPVKTVRYYAEIGLVDPSGRTEAGYRTYSRDQVRKLIFVRRARAFGFSIDQCRDLLRLYEDDNRTSEEVRHLAAERLAEIEAKQRDLQLLHDELSALVTACAGDHRPDCPIIEYLS